MTKGKAIHESAFSFVKCEYFIYTEIRVCGKMPG